MAVPRLIDIGSNLSDPVFRGWYNGKQAHADDFEHILGRARAAGIEKQVLTGDCLKVAEEVIALAQKYKGLYATVGCHPCRANEFEAHPEGPEAYLKALEDLVESDIKSGSPRTVVAIGECGLDYDRLTHSSKATQLAYFPPQLHLATKYDLPLFLHSRAAHEDFANILRAHNELVEAKGGARLRGVVHSHSGTTEEALELIEMGFMIGINGCSLKTEENIACVTALPLSSLLLESDCPWCEIRPSHASYPHLQTLKSSPTHSHLSPLYSIDMVKRKEKFAAGKGVRGRNEPTGTGEVAWVVACLKGISLEEVARVTTENSERLFGIQDGVEVAVNGGGGMLID